MSSNHTKPGAQPKIPGGGKGAFINRNTAIVTFVGATAAYYFWNRSQALPHVPMVTSGAANIEEAHSRGGGSGTHTPAIASPLGHPDQTKGAQLGDKGIASKAWAESHADQRPAKGAVESKFNQSMQGSDTRHSA